MRSSREKFLVGDLLLPTPQPHGFVQLRRQKAEPTLANGQEAIFGGAKPEGSHTKAVGQSGIPETLRSWTEGGLIRYLRCYL